MHVEPAPPGDKLHNPDAESATKGICQGTRALLLQSGLGVKHWPKAMTCFAFQYSATTAPNAQSDSLRGKVDKEMCVEDSEIPGVQWESKLHTALTYPVEGRMFPFGSLVWYKKPDAHGSFEPTGVPALYVGPEVLPAMRFKDTRVLFDLKMLTGEGKVKEIVTKDVIPPAGKWVFPLTSVSMLKSLGSILDQPPEFEDERRPAQNSVYRKGRIEQYGESEGCDGCRLGIYSHTTECRARFNRRLIPSL